MSLSLKGNPLLHQVISAPIHMQVDSTRINYQGGLFIVISD